MGSSVTVAGLSAILMSLLLPMGKREEEKLAAAEKEAEKDAAEAEAMDAV